MKLPNGFLGWHSGKHRFNKDKISISGKSFQHFPLHQINSPKTFPPFIQLKCPFFYQQKITSCAISSLKMVIEFQKNHFKVTNSLKEIDNELFQLSKSKKGVTIEDMEIVGFRFVHLPEIIQKNPKEFFSWISYCLFYLGPIVATVKIFKGLSYHAVVIKGVENQTLIMNDPWYGENQHVSYKHFSKIMNHDEVGFLFLPNPYLDKIFPRREDNILNNLQNMIYSPKIIPILKPGRDCIKLPY